LNWWQWEKAEHRKSYWRQWQEAERARHVVGDRVTWHLIGHLQGNKIKHAATLFDMVETVDALHTATALDRRCADLAKVMSVLIEVNSGLEPGKSGALPEGVPSLARAVSVLPNLRLVGLMTMGPLVADAEEARSYFVLTRQLMESVRQLALPGVDMKYLSMGTTDTYMVAIEEGANLVRIGRGIFGER
jgi:pyridoxal phosphate enzyme (YggS family)